MMRVQCSAGVGCSSVGVQHHLKPPSSSFIAAVSFHLLTHNALQTDYARKPPSIPINPTTTTPNPQLNRADDVTGGAGNNLTVTVTEGAEGVEGAHVELLPETSGDFSLSQVVF